VWLISLRDLQWRRRRFGIAVVVTALVFALTLLLSGVGTSLHSEGRRIVGVFGADSWLVADGTSGPFTTSTFIPAETADEVATIPGVEQADPVVLLFSTIGETDLRDVNVVGYRLGGLGEPPIASGRAPRASGEIVADTALGVDVGERVDVGGQRLRVVGRAEKVTYRFGTATLFLPIRDAQRLALGGQPLASAVVTRGVPRSAPEGLEVLTETQVREDLERPLKSGTQTIDFLNVLLWAVAAGIIGSIVYLSALERVRDFAVFKATGFTSRALVGGLALQATVVAVASALLAAALAKLLVPAFPISVELPASSFVTLFVVALAVALLASLAGLRRAIGVDPAAAFAGA
jgi:putative ABC transport system permease protein